MSKSSFPWLAAGIGLLLSLVLLRFGAIAGPGAQGFPLLSQLLMAEFGFFVTAIGAGLGAHVVVKQGMQPGVLVAGVLCALLALGFAAMGVALWSGNIA